MSLLMKQMRSDVPSDGLIPRSQGEQLFQEMLDGEYATQMSRSKGIGLADMLYRQMNMQAGAAGQIKNAPTCLDKII